MSKMSFLHGASSLAEAGDVCWAEGVTGPPSCPERNLSQDDEDEEHSECRENLEEMSSWVTTSVRLGRQQRTMRAQT